MSQNAGRPIEILLVEDSPSDTQLTIEALREAKMRNHLSLVEDGIQALEFLRRQGPYTQAPRPDLIMLDLNLPRKDGREVLEEIKADPDLRAIPVVVLTNSRAEPHTTLERSMCCIPFVKGTAAPSVPTSPILPARRAIL